MKAKILLIAYYYPPHKGAGVQRPLRLSDQLCRDGWNVTVVSSGCQENDRDYSLLYKVHKNLKLISFRDPLAKFLFRFDKYGLLGRIVGFFAFPDRAILWFLFNRKEIGRLVQSEKFSFVYVTVAPYSASFFGYYLKKKFPKIRLIIDYRDVWSKNPSVKYGKIKPLFSFLNWTFEKKINEVADVITTVSPPLIDDMVGIESKKPVVIYNGYDSNDFVGLRKKDHKKYNILFSGSLYAERNPELFLKPFILFLNEIGSNEHKNISLSFIGDSRSNYISMIKEVVPSTVELEISTYIPHTELLRKAQYSSLFLIIIDNVAGSKGVVTGKIFEYIKLFSPILGIVPLGGEAAKIIKNSNSGAAYGPNDVSGISQFLIEDFTSWKKDNFRTSFNSQKNYDFIEKFSTEFQYSVFKRECLN